MMKMSSRERMMLTLSNKQADKVPVCPDTSYMIPCRMTNKPFYEVLLNGNPPLWKAYIDVLDYFQFDGWFTYGYMAPIYEHYQVEVRYNKAKDSVGRNILETQYITPKGCLSSVETYFEGDSNTPTEKLIKNFKEDFPKFKYLFPHIKAVDTTLFEEQKKALGEKGIMSIGIFPSGFQIFTNYFHGNLEALTYAYYDEPELFEELCEMYNNYSLNHLQLILEHKPDSILTGGSGSITLQSPDLFDKLSLPTLKKITHMCREAGVISGVHSCGKEMHLIKRCAEETELNYVNPLEIAPMGDSDILSAKQKYGHKLALMGNLHTTNVMLLGSANLVRLESLRCIRDGALNGGFVLSTGDQCGRDTKDENIFEMINTREEFGIYPLDMEKINKEIERLERIEKK